MGGQGGTERENSSERGAGGVPVEQVSQAATKPPMELLRSHERSQLKLPPPPPLLLPPSACERSQVRVAHPYLMQWEY